MVKHTQTIRRQFADELFECFDHFVRLTLRLKWIITLAIELVVCPRKKCLIGKLVRRRIAKRNNRGSHTEMFCKKKCPQQGGGLSKGVFL